MKTITLECDELDYAAIQQAMTKRQVEFRLGADKTLLPDGDGNMAARLLAEICRGWMELLDHIDRELEADQ